MADRTGKDIVAVGAARTAIGSFGGTLRDIPACELGTTAIRAAIERARVDPQTIDKVIYANCRQAGNGPNPARTAAVNAGTPVSAPAVTINMACPSGMRTVMFAARELQAAAARLIVAGGMESMSTMPYLLKGARWDGFKSGDKTLMDSWSDTIDPLCGCGMGTTAENLAEKYGISRGAQDEYALLSQQRAASALEGDFFAEEITPFKLPPSKHHPDGQLFSRDEGPRRDTSAERLAKLRPAFKKDGTVTAGNACTMADAACAIVLTTRAQAQALGLSPLFSVVSFAEEAVEPALMGDGPSLSIPRALEAAGMTLSDMDFIEVNEAFASQILSNERTLKWNRDKVNVWGGAIALGHPTGFSGARILITLASILRRNGKEFGVAGICGGGGVTTAMVIRNEA